MQKSLISNSEEYLAYLLNKIEERKAKGKKSLYLFGVTLRDETVKYLREYFKENMPDYTLDITSCGPKDNKVRDIIVLFPKESI